MERAVVDFELDAEGEWVACGDQQGGEAPCLAPLVCPDCGVVLDGSPHRGGCHA